MIRICIVENLETKNSNRFVMENDCVSRKKGFVLMHESSGGIRRCRKALTPDELDINIVVAFPSPTGIYLVQILGAYLWERGTIFLPLFEPIFLRFESDDVDTEL